MWFRLLRNILAKLAVKRKFLFLYSCAYLPSRTHAAENFGYTRVLSLRVKSCTTMKWLHIQDRLIDYK